MTDETTGRFRKVTYRAGPPVAFVGALVVLVRLRPGIGWPLLLVVTALVGAANGVLGEDLRAEAAKARTKHGDFDPGGKLHGESEGASDLTPVSGPVTAWLRWTMLLCLGFLGVSLLRIHVL